MAQVVRRVGNSLGVILPNKALKEVGLEPGARVNILPVGPGELRIIREQGPMDDLTEAQVQLGRQFMARFRRDFEILAGS